jgi:hypothetical protein
MILSTFVAHLASAAFKKVFLIISRVIVQKWNGECRRYNDLLWGGRSGDRTPVEARFFASVQPGSGDNPAPWKIGTGSLSRWESDLGVALTTHRHLVPMLNKE